MKFKEIFDKLLFNLSDLLKNGGTRWSSIRFAFLLAVIISNFSVFGVWVGLSIVTHTMVAIPESVIVLYGLANGISVGGKLIQKSQEKKVKKNDNEI